MANNQKESAPEKWRLKLTPKFAKNGGSRTIHSKDTVSNVLPLLSRLNVDPANGINRVDTDKIPVFIVKRSMENGDVQYYKGKGYLEKDSLASAVMETVERFSAEKYSGVITYCSYSDIQKKGSVVDLRDLAARTTPYYVDGMPVEWVEGFDLIQQKHIYVPLSMVVRPYRTHPETFCSSSVGLAAGNTYVEAISHALCEVIEHDSNAMANLYNPWKYVINLAGSQNTEFNALREQVLMDPTPRLMFPLIDISTLPKRPASVARKLSDAGHTVFLRNTTTEIGVPSVYCGIFRRFPDGAFKMYDGMGTHPDAEIAALRALCEAAQSHSAIEWLQKKGLCKYPPPCYGKPRGTALLWRHMLFFRYAFGPARFY